MTLTPDQIIASRDRLLAEGFHARSTAVVVHDQLLEVMRQTDVASLSMRELIAKCEKHDEIIERLRKASVMAVAPLEALRMSGAVMLLSDETISAIDEGIAAVREVISEREGA